MARSKTPWYTRFKEPQRGFPSGVPSAEDADYSGQELISTSAAYQYLLGSFRTNAPGFDSQNPLAMSQAYTGVTYLSVSAFASQAGQAEVKLFEGNPDEPEEREELSHFEDASQLIHQPNPDDTFGEILEQTALQFKLTGTACLWVPHDVNDRHDTPREMYVLSTASLLPQPLSPQYPNGAYLVQPWYPSGPYGVIPQQQGVGAVVPAEQIVRIKEPHPFFRWIGYATLYAISTQMDAARMIDVTRMNHMQRGFDPSAIVTFDSSVGRPDSAQLRRLEQQLQQTWLGPQNAGRMVVAPFGVEDVKTFGQTPDKMMYQEGWQQLRDFAMAAFRLNAGVAGMTDGLSYATLYASLRWFYIFGLGPFLNKVAQKITRHVLHPHFDRSFLMELTGKSITDEDMQEKQVNTLARYNLAKVGELRRMYKLPPSERDEEWVSPKQEGGGEGAPGGAPGGAGAENNPLAALLGGGGEKEGGPDENAMDRKRPVNEQGKGSKGPQPDVQRKSRTMADRHDRLMGVMEKHLTNGTIKPYKS